MLQVKEASRKTFWPALCAVLASAAAAYALVAWVLQIQSLRQAASAVPVVLSESSVPVGGNNSSHVALALGAPLPSQSTKPGADQSSQAAYQWNLLGVVAGVLGLTALPIRSSRQALRQLQFCVPKGRKPSFPNRMSSNSGTQNCNIP